jgi:DNA phosphorothioation-dependent restriction protein DptH
LLDFTGPTVVRIHLTSNELLQRAFAAFVLYSTYKDMFKRGPQSRITHAIIFDEAHRASRLKLLPTIAKECRKFGIALVLACQEARDFDPSLFSAIASYLALRITEHDAKAIARTASSSDIEKRIIDRLKQLKKYTALFFTEGNTRPITVELAGEPKTTA